MPYSAHVYKVMIASPSDVGAERNIVREVLSEWNVVHAEKRAMVVLPIGWETHASPSMGESPQNIINKQVLKNADILIGVFWTRIGTATDKYASGTVEEIEEHIKTGKPTLLYFSSGPVRPDSVDPEQYSQLISFKKTCQSRGIYQPYQDLNEFKDTLYRHIQLELNKETYEAQQEIDLIPLISARSKMPSMSKEAQHMLLSVSKDHNGSIMRLPHLGGTIIQTDNVSFVEDDNPRSIALWEGVLRELENLGLIESLSHKREMFRVTREGYEMAELVNP